MRQYVLRRLIMLVPVIIGVSILTFLMVHIAPGDPVAVMLPDHATGEEARLLRARLGLDQPLYVQYFSYVRQVLQLDFGHSVRTGRSVGQELFARWPTTVELTIISLSIALLVGIPLGIIAALKRASFTDHACMVFALLGFCLPNFFLALLLQLLFALQLEWLPIYGRGGPLWTWQGFQYFILPGLSLGLSSAGVLARMTRSNMLEVLQVDYIRTARAKGVLERRIIIKHALKNALIPVTTIVGLQFGFLLGGAFITETVFALPGVGRYAVNAIFARDLPVIQAVALMMAMVFVLCNLGVDLLYAFLDPRIRYE